MSEALFLVNPRRKKKRKSRKGRMPAGLRRYWASKRRGAKVHKRRRKRRASSVAAPRRRRTKRYGVATVKRRRRKNPIHRRSHRRHRRSNPFSVRGLTHSLMPAAVGAAGAVALDVAYAYATPYLPASMQTGMVGSLVKLAAAFGLGIGARKFLGREKGNAIMLGALTVTGYGVIKPMIAQFAPSIKGLSGYADYTAMGAYMQQPKLGAYMQPSNRLGFYSPAPVVQPAMSGLGDAGYNWQNDGM